ncbi:class I adenylate-forming enzyme family protein [Geomicrobium sp. JCM 19039]|uniref:class I adenylate-forming enzyme family protein n=1 Tax=Geomicrobium sp. JCM 19039 TaxID=1460636 RepID=UPI00045F391E|nr:AMP-binding protein [Geomicrobium sp. JCM 19039]GAK14093.1 long-chain-fatty-acid-CoA ligase [Geomicrobium sp. JCM 19039]
MQIVKLFNVLRHLGMRSPITIVHLVITMFRSGSNLMTLLEIAAVKYKHREAMTDDGQTVTYNQLLNLSRRKLRALNERVRDNDRVAFMCANHIDFVATVFAVSRLGADVYLLPSRLREPELQDLHEKQSFTLIVHDHTTAPTIAGVTVWNCENQLNETAPGRPSVGRKSSGRLVLFTGGTTGTPKSAAHSPSLFRFLDPFLDFISKLEIMNRERAYVATPLYHGYGIAVLILFLITGKPLYFTKRFDATTAGKLISDHRVDVMTVVPMIVQRLLDTCLPEQLTTLRCMASGGARLDDSVVRRTEKNARYGSLQFVWNFRNGAKLHATPKDLQESPGTIGRPIRGMRAVVMDGDKQQPVGSTGEIHIVNTWSSQSSTSGTGDVGWFDEHGRFYLLGRKDDLVIVGGVNVYPIELEQVLLQHEAIKAAAVIGASDDEYGERLIGFVEMADHTKNTVDDVHTFLEERLQTSKRPRQLISVDALPYTNVGKIDKKTLESQYKSSRFS